MLIMKNQKKKLNLMKNMKMLKIAKYFSLILFY